MWTHTVIIHGETYAVFYIITLNQKPPSLHVCMPNADAEGSLLCLHFPRGLSMGLISINNPAQHVRQSLARHARTSNFADRKSRIFTRHPLSVFAESPKTSKAGCPRCKTFTKTKIGNLLSSVTFSFSPFFTSARTKLFLGHVTLFPSTTCAKETFWGLLPLGPESDGLL